MKTLIQRAATATLALSLLGAPLAMADSRHGDRHDRHDRHDYRHRYDGRQGHDWDRDRHHRRYHGGYYHRPHGYRQHRWRHGERLPRAYYARPYVIHDYHYYALRRPPRGHHWVRVDTDVVLAAIATGLVMDVFYDYFH